MRFAFLTSLLVLAACARIPLEQAEAQCAQVPFYGSPNTAVTIGIGGSVGGTGIGVITGLPQYVDANAAYNACVYRKSGQTPQHALDGQPL